MSETPMTPEAAALATILARVRCELIHRQVNGGRCVNCISWAKRVGVPIHLARLEQALDEQVASELDEAAADIQAFADVTSPATAAAWLQGRAQRRRSVARERIGA